MKPRYHEFLTAFPRRSDSEVRVSLSTAGSEPVIDLRLWWKPRDQEEFLPTRKGATVRLDEVPALIDALQEVLEGAEAAAKE